MSFLSEIKPRNVLRMAGPYLLGAWLIVQVASTVRPMFGASDWIVRSIVIRLAESHWSPPQTIPYAPFARSPKP